jgi:hypothetical protein
MLKIAIMTCAICVGVGGTALWVKSNAPPPVEATVGNGRAMARMPLLQELHLKAHLDNLPVADIKDPF